LDDALEQARTDPLTRVLNRRGFSEALAVEIARARRAGEPLSALMIDLDHFKRLNDRHGHAAGDRTLQQVAQVLRTQLRGIDAVARLGGEEFCVLLPSCPADDAAGRADALCVAVAQPASGALGVTVSIGVATLQDADRDGGALLHAADSALYEAKAAGRNRSAVAAPFIKR
jgi:diguanylate cyclase (GGDEF)-like protein